MVSKVKPRERVPQRRQDLRIFGREEVVFLVEWKHPHYPEFTSLHTHTCRTFSPSWQHTARFTTEGWSYFPVERSGLFEQIMRSLRFVDKPLVRPRGKPEHRPGIWDCSLASDRNQAWAAHLSGGAGREGGGETRCRMGRGIHARSAFSSASVGNISVTGNHVNEW